VVTLLKDLGKGSSTESRDYFNKFESFLKGVEEEKQQSAKLIIQALENKG
jgi:hypothetical protein